MASTSTNISSESTPLLDPQFSPSSEAPKKPSRNVTFNPNPAIISIDGNSSTASRSTQPPSNVLPQNSPSSQSGPQPMLSALNSKLRRRNSYGSPLMLPATPASKIGPQRTTPTSAPTAQMKRAAGMYTRNTRGSKIPPPVAMPPGWGKQIAIVSHE
jgi:hypothetical protein